LREKSKYIKVKRNIAPNNIVKHVPRE